MRRRSITTAMALAASLFGCARNAQPLMVGGNEGEVDFLRTADCVTASLPQAIQFRLPGSPYSLAENSKLESSDISALADSVPLEIRKILIDAVRLSWNDGNDVPLADRESFDTAVGRFQAALLEIAPHELNNAHCGDLSVVQTVQLAAIDDWFARSLTSTDGSSPLQAYFRDIHVDGNRSVEFLMLSVGLHLSGIDIPMTDQISWLQGKRPSSTQ